MGSLPSNLFSRIYFTLGALFLLANCTEAEKSNQQTSAETSPQPAQPSRQAVDPISVDAAKDAVAQYEIVKRHHDTLMKAHTATANDNAELCVHSGLVAAAYLEAKNESKYIKWKEVEKSDCNYYHSVQTLNAINAAMDARSIALDAESALQRKIHAEREAEREADAQAANEEIKAALDRMRERQKVREVQVP